MEKNRLAETLKRHQLMVEYNFYIPKGMDEQEDAPEETPSPEDLPPPPGGQEATPAVPETTPDVPMPEPEPEPVEGEVELDITDLVNSTKDTKDKIEGTNELLNSLISKFDELQNKMTSFDQVLDRINKLETDFEKRLPTPVEKLEMRSLDSFPYSVKLSDFWGEEMQDIEGEEYNKQGKEYTLTPEDIKKDYSPSAIKNSFDVENPEDQDFNQY